VAGYGNSEGLGGSLLGAGSGAVIGGALGYGGGKVGEALAARAAAKAAAPVGEGAQVIQAADNLNAQFGTKIAPLPADVAGPGIQNASAGAAKMPLGAMQIVGAADNLSNEAKAARDAIAAMVGNPAELERAGEAALTGAQKWISNTRNKVNVLYTKARKLGGSEPIDLVDARKVLDDQIAELSQVPGGSKGLDRLTKLRAELDNPVPVEGVRGMRTALRDEFIGDGLRSSDIERRVGMVMDAADNDIVNGLRAAGKGEAADSYAAAAKAHAERLTVIDTVLAPIIGAKGSAPRSGEEIMNALALATKRNNSRLGKFMASLPAEDAATVRATLISRLGRASDGAQNAAGDAFSLSAFLTQWNAMSPAARQTMFGGETRAALENLAKVAGGTKAAQRFQNFSNTGTPMGWLGTIGSVAGAGINPGTLLFIAGDAAGGKLLSSPAFARWLARVPQQPALFSKWIDGLSKIAANDNALVQEISGLRAALERAAGSALPMKTAAQPDEGAQPIPVPLGAGRTTPGQAPR
jgi:hypothetical protein